MSYLPDAASGDVATVCSPRKKGLASVAEHVPHVSGTTWASERARGPSENARGDSAQCGFPAMLDVDGRGSGVKVRW
jgi:hypothetical protein